MLQLGTNVRYFVTLLSFGLACGSSSTSKKGGTHAKGTTATSQGNVGLGSSPAPPSSSVEPDHSLTPEEAKANADRLWQAAEKTPQDSKAWDAAGQALATAAGLVTEAEAKLKLLRGALAAWDRADGVAPPPPKTAPQESRPLPPREVSRIAVLEALSMMLKAEDTERSRVQYRRGRIYWNHGHYDQAIPSFEAVVDNVPGSAEAEYAATLLLDSLLLEKDYAAIDKHVQAMLQNSALLSGRPALMTTLLKIRHQSGIRYASKLIDDKNYSECGILFLDLHKRDAKVEGYQGDQLLYNASVCQERAGQYPTAIKTLQRLVKLYPASPVAAKAKERAEALKKNR